MTSYGHNHKVSDIHCKELKVEFFFTIVVKSVLFTMVTCVKRINYNNALFYYIQIEFFFLIIV